MSFLFSRFFASVIAGLVIGPLSGLAAFGQSTTLSESDYARAERMLSWNIDPLIDYNPTAFQWLSGGRLWYRNPIPDGHEFILADPSTGMRERAFDHERLAAALSAVSDVEYEPFRLPLQQLLPSDDGRLVGFELERRRWECDVIEYRCERPTTALERTTGGVLSPDGRLLAFLRDHNLWVRDLDAGTESQLTTDGTLHYGYATDNEGWRQSPRPALSWSPDSRRIFTHRLDERGVGDMVLWETLEFRPRLQTWKYALPGDTIVPMYQWFIIDVADRRKVPVQMEPDHQRTSSCCGMLRGDELGDVQWSEEGTRIARVSTTRDYTTVTLRIIDVETGAVRTVMSETGDPFFEATAAGRGDPNWRVLFNRNEVLWYSKRDDWGHLYMYDLESGTQKRRLTDGAWNVVTVMEVADDFVYFTGAGREAGRDPYHRHLYRIPLAGGPVSLLTPHDADHVVSISPEAGFFVSTFSTISQPQVTEVRRINGDQVMELERSDISRLLASGWQAPEPFVVRARDGETDIYGVMYRPTNFDPSRRYPIVNHIYPGPQVGSVGPRTFRASRGGNAQALAELGFIVVQIDALGTPMRSNSLHAFYFGDLGDNGLEDQIAGMRQLAERHPYIDLGRVGMYGHSGGGYATARALLAHPDFFHVGVASAGNHDNRGYTYYWGEKWQGQLVRHEDGTDSYTGQANHLLAANLRGRLLISYGTMDANVHPNTTLLLVNELIRHNKDFDLMVMPNRGHGYANEPYKIRRTWDYFVQHLMGATPPREYRINR
jgi:dipeptidyl-peptidase 4